MAVAECAQRQQANLEILAQCVGSEQQERLHITNCLANWSAEVAEKQKLTTTQVTDLQDEMRQLKEATQAAFQNTEEQQLKIRQETKEECEQAVQQILEKTLPPNQGKRILRRFRAATIALSDKSSVTPEKDKEKEKEKEKGKRKRLTAAQLNDLPPLVDGSDPDLQTPHDSDPSSSSSNDDGNGKGLPKTPPGGSGRGAVPSPPPPPPPTQEETFAVLLAQTLRKTMNPDTGRRLPVKAPETFNGEFTKFRGWWKAMQSYLRIYASHIPDDTT